MFYEECARDSSRSYLQTRSGSTGTVTLTNNVGGQWNVKTGGASGDFVQIESMAEMYDIAHLATFK